MTHRQKIAALAVLTALAAGAGAVKGSAESASTTVKVTLKEFSLKPSTKLVSPGKVTFVVRNAGRVDHELVVLRTNRPAKKQGLTSFGDVYEVGRVGRTKPIDARKTETLALILKAGHYALLCNLPGHYRAGQFADLAVR